MSDIFKKIDDKIDECFDQAKRYEISKWHDESRICYNRAQVWQEAKRLILDDRKTQDISVYNLMN